MQFKTARFLKGAVTLDDCPDAEYPEICFAGRSNVGKSSIINALLNRKSLARTSNVPGKTQQMNYYEVDEEAYIVDLPGYGYAKVPEAERKRWGRNIKEYLLNREPLKLVLHLIDIRHKPTQLDQDFIYWMASNQLPFALVLTKADKISHNKQQKSIAVLERQMEEINVELPYVVCSAKTGKGMKQLKRLINDFLDDLYITPES